MKRSSTSTHWSTREVGQLGGDDRAGARAAGRPQTSVTCATLPSSPRQRADHLVAEVELPVGVALGGLGGEVGGRRRCRPARRPRRRHERDVAEELQPGRRRRGGGHVGAPGVGAVRVEGDLAGSPRSSPLGVDLVAGAVEGVGQACAPSGRRAAPSWGGSAAKRGTKRSVGAIGAGRLPAPGVLVSSSSVTGPSLTSSTAISAPNTPRAAPARSQKRRYSGSACGGRRGRDVRGPVALAARRRTA